MITNPSNRAHLYEDSFFETLRSFQKQIPLWPLHKLRITNTLHILQYPKEWLYQIEEEFEQILGSLEYEKTYKIRWHAYRVGIRDYASASAEPAMEWIVEERNDLDNVFIEKAVIYAKQYKAFGELSPIKSGSALLYIKAADYALQQHANEAVILSSEGYVSEMCRSNVWLYDGEYWSTPDLKSACVDGVFRKFILSTAHIFHQKVKEEKITIEALQQAKSVVLSNALRGVQVLKRLEDIEFETEPGLAFRQHFHAIWTDISRMKELF